MRHDKVLVLDAVMPLFFTAEFFFCYLISNPFVFCRKIKRGKFSSLFLKRINTDRLAHCCMIEEGQQLTSFNIKQALQGSDIKFCIFLQGDAFAFQTVHRCQFKKHRCFEQNQFQHSFCPQDVDDNLSWNGATCLYGVPMDHRKLDFTSVRKASVSLLNTSSFCHLRI